MAAWHHSSQWEWESSVSCKHTGIPARHCVSTHHAAHHGPLPWQMKEDLCWLSTGAQLAAEFPENTGTFFFHAEKLQQMTNNPGRSKFPTALHLLFSQSRGRFVETQCSWGGGPQGRSRAASREGSSSQEAKRQTFPSQNTWVGLHSVKRWSLTWKADAF